MLVSRQLALTTLVCRLWGVPWVCAGHLLTTSATTDYCFLLRLCALHQPCMQCALGVCRAPVALMLLAVASWQPRPSCRPVQLLASGYQPCATVQARPGCAHACIAVFAGCSHCAADAQLQQSSCQFSRGLLRQVVRVTCTGCMRGALPPSNSTRVSAIYTCGAVMHHKQYYND